MNGFPFNITFINQLLVFCVPPFSSSLYFCIVTRVPETTQPEMCQKISKNIWSIIEDWITFLFEGKALTIFCLYKANNVCL